MTAATVVSTASAHTLYAQWTGNTYEVTFSGEGGTPSTATKDVTFASAYGTLPTASWTGYGFDGWFTAATGGTEVTAATVVSTASAHTLYAQWTANSYEVTFSGEGGTPSTGTKDVTFASAYGTLPTASRTGYGFDGWFTAATGGTEVTAATVVSTASAHTLYAQWTANSYQVTFSGEGGTPSTGTKDVTFAAAYGMLPTASRTGYAFDGWYTAATGGTEVTALTLVSTASAHTLYAQWTANTYEVTFSGEGGTPSTATKDVTFASAYGTLPTASRTGYTLAGWYTAATGGTEVTAATVVSTASAHTLYAQWTANTYEVTFSGEGGTPSTGTKDVTFAAAYGVLPTASRTGYGFDGWFTAATGGTEVTALTLVSTASDHTLYAQWTANSYEVTFSGEGGTPSTGTKDVTFASAYGTLPTASRTGYAFDGWFTAATGGAEVIAATVVSTASAHTLYAQWTANTYEVTFSGEGGTPSTATKDVIFDAAYGTLPTASRTGYTLAGWYTAATGGTEVTAATIVSTGSDHTLYAQWTANSYEVTFSGEGGTPSTGTKDVTFASAYGMLPTASRTGYAFDGWYTAATGGTEVTALTLVSTASAHTLYAQWTANTYEVTFSGEGGTPSTPTKDVIFDAVYGTLPTASRTGYTLAGWYTAATGGTQVTAATVVSTASAHTLYAHWTNNTFEVTFSGQGGTPSEATIEVTFAAPYGTLPTASRTGYAFDGWYTAVTGGTEVTALTLVSTASAHTLYAQWTANSYEVTFSGEGGTPSTGTKDVTFASAYGTLPTASRTGYAFDGWYTAATGGTEVTAATVVSTASAHTLYAQWTANSYEVTFSGEGGTPSTAPKDVTLASAYGPLPTASRTGY
ncbi:MAG: beta strand repeat-containing protein [Lachnospiraceae bacterium]